MSTPNQQLAEPPDYSSPIAAELRDTFRALDALGPGVIAVLSRSITSPPGGALQGARYIVPAGALLDWAGHQRHVAYLTPEGWNFRPPRRGWMARVLDEGGDQGFTLTYDGTEWISATIDALEVTFDGYAAGLDSTTVDGALEELVGGLISTNGDVAALEVTAADHEFRITALETAGGGGGGGGNANITVDSHPPLPDAIDDEFEYGTTLDTAGARVTGATAWVSAFTAGTVTEDVNQGCWRLRCSAASSVRNIELPITGTFRVRARLMPIFSGNDCYLDFYVGEPGGTFVSVGVDTSGSGSTRYHAFRWSSHGSAVAFPVTFDVAVDWRLWGDWIYIEWEYDGTNIIARRSATGIDGTFVAFHSELAATFLGGAPDKIGFQYLQSNTNANIVLVDWVRRMA